MWFQSRHHTSIYRCSPGTDVPTSVEPKMSSSRAASTTSLRQMRSNTTVARRIGCCMTYIPPTSQVCTRRLATGRRAQYSSPAPSPLLRQPRLSSTFKASVRRGHATVTNAPPKDHGPLDEYDRRVIEGILRNDEHQRGKLLYIQVACALSSLYLSRHYREFTESSQCSSQLPCSPCKTS